VHRDPYNYSGYPEQNNNHSNEIDYAHPEYYHSQDEPPPRSAQPVQPLDPYSGQSVDYNPYGDMSNVPYDNAQMNEYRGPQHMEGYTVDAGVEQREAAKVGSAEGRSKKRGLAGLGGGIVAIGLWLLKLKAFAFLLQFGWASITAIFSIAIYSLIFGWPFAIGLVVLLFIHEMGHALVMKIKGIPIGALIFIPLMGASVIMRQMPQNARDEAEVGIAGPIAGAISSGVCLFLAQTSPNTIWAPLAYFGFFINLFNLVPIVPFDGGRVLAAIDRRVWILGFLGLLAFMIWQWVNGMFSIWLLFFVIMAASQLWTRGRAPNTPEERAYYDVPLRTRISLGVLYFGLIAVLVLGMSISHSLILGVR